MTAAAQTVSIGLAGSLEICAPDFVRVLSFATSDTGTFEEFFSLRPRASLGSVYIN